MNKIVNLIKQDPIRVEALSQVYKLNLPQCYIAAGFVRNVVWDAIHSYKTPTVLNDVDVIYFDPTESSAQAFLEYESLLKARMPTLNWQVRNQAKMHERNGDKPYQSTIDAMRYWPEKETAVAIRQLQSNKYECVAAFGFDSLLKGCITFNPQRSQDVFLQRVTSKGWLKTWPNLDIVL